MLDALITNPDWLARLQRVGSLPRLLDDVTEMIERFSDPDLDQVAVILMRSEVYGLASRIEDARVLLAGLCYPIPRSSFLEDPIGYFICARDHFERVIPTLDWTGDAEGEMFKANLAGRN